nr:hypothetical protein CFP56_16543 [Quercus suber]
MRYSCCTAVSWQRTALTRLFIFLEHRPYQLNSNSNRIRCPQPRPFPRSVSTRGLNQGNADPTIPHSEASGGERTALTRLFIFLEHRPYQLNSNSNRIRCPQPRPFPRSVSTRGLNQGNADPTIPHSEASGGEVAGA